MHGKREHPQAEWRDLPLAQRQRTEIDQHLLGVRERAWIRWFEPAEVRHVVDAARLPRQDDPGEIEPLHFRQLLRRAIEMFALRPEPQTMSGCSAARASCTLIGGSAADLLHEQRIDPASRIEPRDPRQSTVDYDT